MEIQAGRLPGLRDLDGLATWLSDDLAAFGWARGIVMRKFRGRYSGGSEFLSRLRGPLQVHKQLSHWSVSG